MSDLNANANSSTPSLRASMSTIRARNFRRYLFEGLGLALIMIAGSAGGAAVDSADVFNKEVELARGFEMGYPKIGVEADREKALLHYRNALALRPEASESMMVAFHIGGILLAMDDDPARQREGARVFEELLETYDYMDYYEANPSYQSDSPQFKMITAAIYAAGHQEPEKARATYLKGMEFLTATYRRRLEQWTNEKAPEQPEVGGPYEGDEIGQSKWRSRHQAWEEHQQKAAARDVFPPDTIERVFVASLLRYYVDTFRPFPAEKLPEILDSVITKFRDSPFEKRARELLTVSGAEE